MKSAFLISLLVLTVLCCGCAKYYGKSKKVILQHPETLEFVDCQMDRWETAKSFAENDKCIEEYKKKGFVVWGER